MIAKELLPDQDPAREMIRLLEEQKTSWPLLRSNLKNLEKVKIQLFQFGGSQIIAQFNPARIISTSAEVTKQAIEARPCFLCSQNLPAEQAALLLNNSFIILCNPYPILKEHFTIAKNVHQPQAIKQHFKEMLELSRKTAGKFSILYNGPRCGASAPDHMHFQAITSNAVQLEKELPFLSAEHLCGNFSSNEVKLRFVEDSLRRFIVIESSGIEELADAFNMIYDLLQSILGTNDEPMMNMTSFFGAGKLHVIIFPRSKHRPEQYFAGGEEKLLISPAVVDLAGLLVVPREEDYKKLTAEIIADVFRQVSVDEETFYLLMEKVIV